MLPTEVPVFVPYPSFQLVCKTSVVLTEWREEIVLATLGRKKKIVFFQRPLGGYIYDTSERRYKREEYNLR